MYIYVYKFMVNVMVHMEKAVHLSKGILIWNDQMFLPKPRQQFWNHEKPIEVEYTCKENLLERFQLPSNLNCFKNTK